MFWEYDVLLVLFLTHEFSLIFFPSEACGGPNRLSVYSSTRPIVALPVPTPQTTDLPGKWTYAGCLRRVTQFCPDIVPVLTIVIERSRMAGCSLIKSSGLETTLLWLV